MAIHYRLYQNKNQKSDYFQKWYGRAVNMGTVDTEELASIIEANCTVKRSDILAVLSELTVTMKQQLLDSKRVKLDHLGAFKVAMQTERADTAEKFVPKKNIKSLRIIFQPEVRVKQGRYVKTLLDGATVAELPTYKVEKQKQGA